MPENRRRGSTTCPDCGSGHISWNGHSVWRRADGVKKRTKRRLCHNCGKQFNVGNRMTCKVG